MNKELVEKWLIASLQKTREALELAPDWWPTNDGNCQALSTAWATMFFIEAGIESCAGETLVARCSEGRSAYSRRILEQYWISDDRKTDASQLMLDFSIMNPNSSCPIQLTGESEMFVNHSTSPEPVPDNGYAWDFLKLLIVPSSTRLFVARLAGSEGLRAPERIKTLASSLRLIIDRYGSTFLRPNDTLAAVLLPAGKTQMDATIVLWVNNGRVRFEMVTPGLFNQGGETATSKPAHALVR